MSKYIKIDDIRNALVELSESGKWLERETTMDIIKALGNLPRIDIVHCGECKHYRTAIPQVGGTYNGCGVWNDEGNEIEVEPNQFCSYGERIEE